MGEKRYISTEYAIYLQMEKITVTWDKSQVASILFLDDSRAFDNVSHKRLLHNLRKRKGNAQIIT